MLREAGPEEEYFSFVLCAGGLIRCGGMSSGADLQDHAAELVSCQAALTLEELKHHKCKNVSKELLADERL